MFDEPRDRSFRVHRILVIDLLLIDRPRSSKYLLPYVWLEAVRGQCTQFRKNEKEMFECVARSICDTCLDSFILFCFFIFLFCFAFLFKSVSPSYHLR